MDTSPKSIDRRAQQTHQLLQQASIEVIQEKGFLGTTIQNITDRAHVNRGTFYAHFPDKYALLDEIIREQLRRLLERKLPPVPSWDRRTLHLLIQIVLEHFEDQYHQCDPAEFIDPLIERATQETLAEILFTWLKQGQSAETHQQVPMEMIARVMSWTILGAAVHWSQEEAITMSPEQVANDILLVVMGGTFRTTDDL